MLEVSGVRDGKGQNSVLGPQKGAEGGPRQVPSLPGPAPTVLMFHWLASVTWPFLVAGEVGLDCVLCLGCPI